MSGRRLGALASALAVVGACLPAGAAADGLEIAPVTRLPFPERGYVVSAPGARPLDGASIAVEENGRLVREVHVTPLAESGLLVGVVLAIDASESMSGPPFTAALRAARAFAAHRQPGEELGLVAFNGDVSVLQTPTQDDAALLEALRSPPELAYGTRIYDALSSSLDLLRTAKVSAGSIVLLSDGADLGSRLEVEDVVAVARRQRVRIFTVGLRSGAFDGSALRAIADRTGGAYAEASSAAELEAIYSGLGRRLASEYLVRYRSDARPQSEVDVEIAVAGVGTASVDYLAPTPTRAAPYHRSLVSRFVLSPVSLVAVGVLFAALLTWALFLLAGRPTRSLVERIGPFSLAPQPEPPVRQAPPPRRPAAGARPAQGWWARLERDFEIARIERTPTQVVALTLASSLVLVVVLLATVSPVVALLGLLLPPVVARGVVRAKLGRLRDEFADQLPAVLQVLASSLRAGHSFSGALDVVVENAHEPARSELRRVVQDHQLGVASEVAIRRMAERMKCRDLEQVALLAELQRTAGGNSAEVLDTVVETIRQRGELRRLVRTLTAQGRMARWILTALPAVLTLFLWFMQPEVMGSFFSTGLGQVFLLVAVLMVATGSLVIQRIVDIEV